MKKDIDSVIRRWDLKWGDIGASEGELKSESVGGEWHAEKPKEDQENVTKEDKDYHGVPMG